MIILGTNSIKDTGYNVDNSCIFDRASTDNMTKSMSDGSSIKGTFSAWIKVDGTGNEMNILSHFQDTNNVFTIATSGSGVYVIDYNSGYSLQLQTNRIIRDPSAWFHLYIAIDRSQGTANNRNRMFINGVEETSFSNRTNYSQQTSGSHEDAISMNDGQCTMYLGGLGDGNQMFGGYLAEVHWVDGTVPAVTEFGEFDEDSGIWKPKLVSGISYGTNGFYLDFQDASNLGNDANGGTDLTENNIASTNQTTDTCTNNFATLNPLIATAYGSQLSNGNLDCVQSDVRGRFHNVTTIGASNGKYYAEIKLTGGSNHVLGVATDASFTYASTLLTSGFNYLGQSDTLSYSYYVADGTVYVNGTNSSHGATLTTNDILGIYLDLDNHKLYFSKNGALQSSTGIDIPTGYDYFFGVGDLGTGGAGEVSCNFGNPAFSISSSNTDDNGYGNFEYSPNITGDGVAKKFYALNTKNLAEYG
jgi:hypothetical protein